jgi:hypothetical protein
MLLVDGNYLFMIRQIFISQLNSKSYKSHSCSIKGRSSELRKTRDRCQIALFLDNMDVFWFNFLTCITVRGKKKKLALNSNKMFSLFFTVAAVLGDFYCSDNRNDPSGSFLRIVPCFIASALKSLRTGITGNYGLYDRRCFQRPSKLQTAFASTIRW